MVDLQAMDVLLGERINRVDHHASAGTAMAIAMGGAAFLPNKNVNFNGNVGYYHKAWAAAINLSAMIVRMRVQRGSRLWLQPGRKARRPRRHDARLWWRGSAASAAAAAAASASASARDTNLSGRVGDPGDGRLSASASAAATAASTGRRAW